jgi:hypothetical protein
MPKLPAPVALLASLSALPVLAQCQPPVQSFAVRQRQTDDLKAMATELNTTQLATRPTFPQQAAPLCLPRSCLRPNMPMA